MGEPLREQPLSTKSVDSNNKNVSVPESELLCQQNAVLCAKLKETNQCLKEQCPQYNPPQSTLELFEESAGFLYLSTLVFKRKTKDEDGNTIYEELYLKDIILEDCSVPEAASIFRDSPPQGGWKWMFNAHQRRLLLSHVICKDLEQKGCFIQDEYNVLYYFLDTEKTLLIVSEDLKKYSPNFKSYVKQWYLIFSRSEDCILDYILEYATCHNEKRTVHQFFHYDMNENVLYIFDRKNAYFRLDGSEIRKHSNGTHLLFREDTEYGQSVISYVALEERLENIKDIEILGLLRQAKNSHFLWDVLFNRTNFETKTACSPDQQTVQVILHFYLLPFLDYFDAHPILAFVGEKGSGKTFILRMIGALLLGLKYKLIKITKKEEDFVVAAVNTPLLFLDNVDDKDKKVNSWLLDHLATIATGARLVKRKLYSEYRPSGAIYLNFPGFTTRTVYINRDDLVDRMIINNVKRFDVYYNPIRLFEPLLKCYNELWSFYLDDLNLIVKKIREEGIPLLETNHRLADWVEFANVVNLTLDVCSNYSVDFDELLKNMDNERTSFVFENNSLWPYLKEIAENPENQGTIFYAKDLVEKVKAIAPNYKIYPNTLTTQLKNLRLELSKLLDFRLEYNASRKVYEFSFGEPNVSKPSQGKLIIQQEARTMQALLQVEVNKLVKNPAEISGFRKSDGNGLSVFFNSIFQQVPQDKLVNGAASLELLYERARLLMSGGIHPPEFAQRIVYLMNEARICQPKEGFFKPM